MREITSLLYVFRLPHSECEPLASIFKCRVRVQKKLVNDNDGLTPINYSCSGHFEVVHVQKKVTNEDGLPPITYDRGGHYEVMVLILRSFQLTHKPHYLVRTNLKSGNRIISQIRFLSTRPY
ncbi:hypothetical protein NDU88_008280 [Pleurodeles waltl]|uniref:Uncharacterized protein n=1 Tax=Pleurodeles waltl TaxID=8319 RepID=A0AAV7RSP9_PLEWA|nr:hypothetical protein NDU88_008280 [Pleurodeles waltl]